MARAPFNRAARGMTLIEVLVTSVIAMLVLTALTSIFLAQSRQYQTMASRRDAQAGSRDPAVPGRGDGRGGVEGTASG